MNRSIFILPVLTILLFGSTRVFSQGNGHPGGGKRGPNRTAEEQRAFCEMLVDDAKDLEIKFLNLEGITVPKIGTYDESVFFDKIKSMSLNCLAKYVDVMKNGVKPSCAGDTVSESMKVLLKLHTIWKQGIEEPRKCENVFLKRSHYFKNLEVVIHPYQEKKNEGTTSPSSK